MFSSSLHQEDADSMEVHQSLSRRASSVTFLWVGVSFWVGVGVVAVGAVIVAFVRAPSGFGSKSFKDEEENAAARLGLEFSCRMSVVPRVSSRFSFVGPLRPSLFLRRRRTIKTATTTTRRALMTTPKMTGRFIGASESSLVLLEEGVLLFSGKLLLVPRWVLVSSTGAVVGLFVEAGTVKGSSVGMSSTGAAVGLLVEAGKVKGASVGVSSGVSTAVGALVLAVGVPVGEYDGVSVGESVIGRSWI